MLYWPINAKVKNFIGLFAGRATLLNSHSVLQFYSAALFKLMLSLVSQGPLSLLPSMDASAVKAAMVRLFPL